MNIVDGKLTESKNQSEIIKKFIERWETKVAEIKKQSFDRRTCLAINKDFYNELDNLINFDSMSLATNFSLINQLKGDLNFAIYSAYSNFRKENKHFGFYSLRD